jgi:OOP family OmpA-OmpF porin
MHIVSLLVGLVGAAGVVAHAAPPQDFGGTGTAVGDYPFVGPAEERPAVAAVAAVVAEPDDPPPLPPANIAGRWVGTWTGVAADLHRTGDVVAEFTQAGATASGTLILHDTNAADGIPNALRWAGSAGVGVEVDITGSEVVVTHERGGGVLTAEFVVHGERMVGRFQNTPTPVRVVLTREPDPAVVAQASHVDEPPAPALSAELDEVRGLAHRALSAAEAASSLAERASAAAERSAATADRALEKTEQNGAQAVPASDTQPRPEIVETTSVTFAFDRWDLEAAAQKALRDLTDELRERPELMVNLEGYTDPVGTPEYNIGLSQRRVAAVVNYLVGNGVELSRIHWVGLGKMAASGAPEDRAKQRRVTLKLAAVPASVR